MWHSCSDKIQCQNLDTMVLPFCVFDVPGAGEILGTKRGNKTPPLCHWCFVGSECFLEEATQNQTMRHSNCVLSAFGCSRIDKAIALRSKLSMHSTASTFANFSFFGIHLSVDTYANWDFDPMHILSLGISQLLKKCLWGHLVDGKKNIRRMVEQQ